MYQYIVQCTIRGTDFISHKFPQKKESNGETFRSDPSCVTHIVSVNTVRPLLSAVRGCTEFWPQKPRIIEFRG